MSEGEDALNAFWSSWLSHDRKKALLLWKTADEDSEIKQNLVALWGVGCFLLWEPFSLDSHAWMEHFQNKAPDSASLILLAVRLQSDILSEYAGALHLLKSLEPDPTFFPGICFERFLLLTFLSTQLRRTQDLPTLEWFEAHLSSSEKINSGSRDLLRHASFIANTALSDKSEGNKVRLMVQDIEAKRALTAVHLPFAAIMFDTLDIAVYRILCDGVMPHRAIASYILTLQEEIFSTSATILSPLRLGKKFTFMGACYSYNERFDKGYQYLLFGLWLTEISLVEREVCLCQLICMQYVILLGLIPSNWKDHVSKIVPYAMRSRLNTFVVYAIGSRGILASQEGDVETAQEARKRLIDFKSSHAFKEVRLSWIYVVWEILEDYSAFRQIESKAEPKIIFKMLAEKYASLRPQIESVCRDNPLPEFFATFADALLNGEGATESLEKLCLKLHERESSPTAMSWLAWMMLQIHGEDLFSMNIANYFVLSTIKNLLLRWRSVKTLEPFARAPLLQHLFTVRSHTPWSLLGDFAKCLELSLQQTQSRSETCFRFGIGYLMVFGADQLDIRVSLQGTQEQVGLFKIRRNRTEACYDFNDTSSAIVTEWGTSTLEDFILEKKKFVAGSFRMRNGWHCKLAGNRVVFVQNQKNIAFSINNKTPEYASQVIRELLLSEPMLATLSSFEQCLDRQQGENFGGQNFTQNRNEVIDTSRAEFEKMLETERIRLRNTVAELEQVNIKLALQMAREKELLMEKANAEQQSLLAERQAAHDRELRELEKVQNRDKIHTMLAVADRFNSPATTILNGVDGIRHSLAQADMGSDTTQRILARLRFIEEAARQILVISQELNRWRESDVSIENEKLKLSS